MQRTKYFNQTRPTETQLNWTDNSKGTAIRRRLLSTSQMGVKSGFQVTLNTDTTKIDIARGEGYTGGTFSNNIFEGKDAGERVGSYYDTTSGEVVKPIITAVSMADPAASAKNYVTLLYADSESTALAERSFPFTSHNTVVTETFSASVLTATQWNSLSANEKSERVLVAIVTVPSSGMPLTLDSIEQFAQPKNLPTASALQTILGVTIERVVDGTPYGDGTVRWNTTQLFWKAPGDSEGAGVAITASGEYTLLSSNTAYSIDVSVVLGTLALIPAYTETVTISALYGRTIPMFSAVDQIHRDMIGTGIVSVTNPHGISVDDISGGGLDHAELFHENGITYNADVSQLATSLDYANDIILVTNLGGNDNRFMIEGKILSTVYSVAPGVSASIDFDAMPQPTAGVYMIFLYGDGILEKVKIAGYTAGVEKPLWTDNIKIVDIHNKVAGTGTISWDVSEETLTYVAQGDTVGIPVRISKVSGAYSGYYKLYSTSSDPGLRPNWIIVNVVATPGGIDASSSFTVAKNETSNYPDSSILKLATVNWTGPGAGSEHLLDLIDIRNYITADDKKPFLEEHDAWGHHNKVIPHVVRAAVATGPAFDGSASMGPAVYGSAVVGGGVVGHGATAVGVLGFASSSQGVQGQAPNQAVYGIATTVQGVYGAASSIGVEGAATLVGVRGTATTRIGVQGNAPATAIYGIAAAGVGVLGEAVSTAIRGVANNVGGDFVAVTNTAVYAHAVATAIHADAAASNAIYAYATASVAISALAPHDAIVATGTASHAIIASASYAAISVTASTYAITAAAGNSAIVGEAGGGKVGVYGHGAGAGVSGSADMIGGVVGSAMLGGVVGSAAAYGVWGIATDVYGVYGAATNSFGVCGSAPISAVFGTARHNAVVGKVNSSVAGTIQAVYGTATNTDVGGFAYGVYGEGNAPTYGIGLRGSGNFMGVAGVGGVYGIAAYGEASNAGEAIGAYLSATNLSVDGTAIGASVYAAGAAKAIGLKANMGGQAATAIYGLVDHANGYVVRADNPSGCAMSVYGSMGVRVSADVVGVYAEAAAAYCSGGFFKGIGATAFGVVGYANGNSAAGGYFAADGFDAHAALFDGIIAFTNVTVSAGKAGVDEYLPIKMNVGIRYVKLYT